MTASPPYDTRASRSITNSHFLQEYSLRSRLSSTVFTSEPPSRRGSYYWHGQYYEIDENTRPEWIDAGRKYRRTSAAASSAPSSTPEIVTEQLHDTVWYKLAKMPPAHVSTFRAPAALTCSSGSTSSITKQKLPPLSFFDLPDEIRSRIYGPAVPTGRAIALEHDAPFVRLEPNPALVSHRIRKECLPLFYAENEFRCPFHGVLYKFLKQLDLFKLRVLRCVRLTTPLSHSGFVSLLFEKLLEMQKDGLKDDVVLVALEIEDEGLNWVAQTHLDDLEGISGRWQGPGVAKRRAATRLLPPSLPSPDDPATTHVSPLLPTVLSSSPYVLTTSPTASPCSNSDSITAPAPSTPPHSPSSPKHRAKPDIRRPKIHASDRRPLNTNK